MKTVSVITVCLNAADHIEAAVQSLEQQTYPRIEYVVIDGGSTDGTLEIVDRHRSRVDYLVSEPDTGLYNAMNKGIRAASGDVLYFLNADDRLVDPEVLTDMMAPFAADEDLDLVYGEILLDRDGRIVDWWQQVPEATRKWLCKSTICHQCLFVSASVFDTVGAFDEQYRAVADYDWLYRAVVDHGVSTLHVDRRVAIMGTTGITFGSSGWKNEKREIMKRYYTASERFWWRTVPRRIRPPVQRARLAVTWPFRKARYALGQFVHGRLASFAARDHRNR